MVLLQFAEQFPTYLQRWEALAFLSAMLASALLVSLVVIIALIHAACAPYSMSCSWNLTCMCVCMKRCKRPKKSEVIMIDDSPPPTMKTCSPFKPTPTPRRRAVYRGGRRGPMHRRSSTVARNPTIPHHCGYSCVLKLKGENVSIKKLKSLRAQVATKLEDHYWKGDEICGLDVREVVT